MNINTSISHAALLRLAVSSALGIPAELKPISLFLAHNRVIDLRSPRQCLRNRPLHK